MKLMTEYLAEAVKFERMADDAIDEKAKAAFKNQAEAIESWQSREHTISALLCLISRCISAVNMWFRLS